MREKFGTNRQKTPQNPRQDRSSVMFVGDCRSIAVVFYEMLFQGI